jgi:hypothetical protein
MLASKTDNDEKNGIIFPDIGDTFLHWSEKMLALFPQQNQGNNVQGRNYNTLIQGTDSIALSPRKTQRQSIFHVQHPPASTNYTQKAGFVDSPRRIGSRDKQIYCRETKTYMKGKKEKSRNIQHQRLIQQEKNTTYTHGQEQARKCVSVTRRVSTQSHPQLPKGNDPLKVVTPQRRCVERHVFFEEPWGMVIGHGDMEEAGRNSLYGEMTMSQPNLPPQEVGANAPLPDRVITGLPEATWPVVPEEYTFQEVSLWEFTNLYVLLGRKDWVTLSTLLKGVNLSTVSREIGIGVATLSNIRDSPDQSIVVPNLKCLCQYAEMDLSQVERNARAVRFSTRGDLEYLVFPFVMDIYAWRVLSHIAGDGNVHFRKYPDLRWIQLPKNQGPMRTLLSRLSREVGGTDDQVWYPKALTYAILGTIRGITFRDLRTPSFLQFVLNLPSRYREWKVQFLAAFIVDDGCISQDISITQKDERVLRLLMRLCEQLGYDHSPLYRHKRDGVHNFQLRQEGVQSFVYDVTPLYVRDPLLGLWHKHTQFLAVANSFSSERKLDQQLAVHVCTTVLQILEDGNIHSTDDLRVHPTLQPYLEGLQPYVLNRRLGTLHRSMNLIHEELKNDGSSYRPKRWYIPHCTTSEHLIRVFNEKYNARSHAHSYKRRNITSQMVEEAIEELNAQGVKPSALNVSRFIGCSKKQLYVREDLREYFIRK